MREEKTQLKKLAANLAQLAAKSGASPETCSDLQDTIVHLDRVTGTNNWREVAKIDRRLTQLCRQVPSNVAAIIRNLRQFTSDKSLRALLSYALFLLILTPVASYLLILLFRIGSQTNPDQFDSPAFNDAVKGAVSFALYLPLLLANKINKSFRCPVVRPTFLPVLLLLAFVATIEYLAANFYFLNPDGFSLAAFWDHARTSASTRWLYPLPLVVIVMNVLTAARFVRYSEEAAEFLGSELGGYAKFLITAIGAIAISAIIRLGFAYFDSPREPVPDDTTSHRHMVATTNRLNLRGCPDTVNCTVLQTLPKGARLYVLGKQGEWLRVQLLDDEEQSGWVNAPFTEPVQ